MDLAEDERSNAVPMQCCGWTWQTYMAPTSGYKKPAPTLEALLSVMIGRRRSRDSAPGSNFPYGQNEGGGHSAGAGVVTQADVEQRVSEKAGEGM